MFFYFLVSSLGAGFLYYNKDYCKKIAMNILWNTTRKYHEYSIYLEELRAENQKLQPTLIEMVDKDSLYVKQYNINRKTQICMRIEDYENLEGTLDFLVKNDLYKTIEKTKSLNSEDLLKEDFDKAENIFISIEINLNSKNIDITNDMKPFYIINNTILDKTFVEWFLKTEKHIDLNNEEYVISLIDNNVNMIELKKDQYIFIKNKRDYSIETKK